MAALAATSVLTDDEFILPPRFTVDGRPESVARETRRNLGHAIEELTDDEIQQIATHAEAHKQLGQRVFLEVSYGELAGSTDASLQFKKSGADITAAYTFYKDEEEGRDKRLLRELKRMEYLEKVIMPMLATTDRNNSVGVVQGMIRSSSAFVKGLQSVFKQVETLSKAIERGLHNKSEMPSAEQKTAAIQSIQTTLSKLQPSAANHLAIKNMVQQQVAALLKNIATPVTVLRADAKATAAPVSAVTARNTAPATPVAATSKTAHAIAGATTTTPTSALSSVLPRTQTPVQAKSVQAASTQPVTRPTATTAASTVANTIARPIASTLTSTTAQANTLQTRSLTTAMPATSLAVSQVISTRFSALTNPAIAERVQAQLTAAPLVARAAGTVAATAAVPLRATGIAASITTTTRNTVSTVPLSNPQGTAPATSGITPSGAVTSSATVSAGSVSGASVSSATLRVVATNPELQRTPPSTERGHFTVIDSKAGQQVLSTLAQNTPVQNIPVQNIQAQNTLPPSAPVQAQPMAVQPVAQQMPSSLPAQPTVSQPTAIQLLTAPTVVQLAATATQPTAVQPSTATNQVAATPPAGQPATAQSTPAGNTAVQSQPTAVRPANPAQQQEDTKAEVQVSPQKSNIKDRSTEEKQEAKALVIDPKSKGDAELEKKEDIKDKFKENKQKLCPGCQLGGNCTLCKVNTATLTGNGTATVSFGNMTQDDIKKAKEQFVINGADCNNCKGGCPGCPGRISVTVVEEKKSKRADALRVLSHSAKSQPTVN